MNQATILLPTVAMVLLTALVWSRALAARVGELRTRRIRPQALATRAEIGTTLKDSAASADHFMNLFEMPVLFYTATVLLYATELTDQFYAITAWLYVACRCVHAYIHLTYNRVFHRFLAFTASALVLWILWARLGWQLFQRAWAGGV
jgi:hypothetical protein